jgi:cardiolipin synthase
MNFRNHRKIFVVDGTTAFVGGRNVGNEYLGLHLKLSPWRDTHVELGGPAALSVQLTFVEDESRVAANLRVSPSPRTSSRRGGCCRLPLFGPRGSPRAGRSGTKVSRWGADWPYRL